MYLKRLNSSLIFAVALTGCGNSSPQYQMIPAIAHGNIAKVESLLNDTTHVDINWRAGGKGDSALSSAADFNQVAIVSLLLQRGADPNIATDEGETPLQSAAYHGNAEIVKMLIDAGAKVNAAETLYGFTALASAARHGHIRVIKLLLNAGADPKARIKDGRTAVEIAEHYGHGNAADVIRFYKPETAEQPTENPHLPVSP